jgi:hypothetical protein
VSLGVNILTSAGVAQIAVDSVPSSMDDLKKTLIGLLASTVSLLVVEGVKYLKTRLRTKRSGNQTNKTSQKIDSEKISGLLTDQPVTIPLENKQR